jgi:hypothetical protein
MEPLPDIDFNIRAGNTLVGFASLEELRKALSADMVKQLALPDIEGRAEAADCAFHQFRAMQTEQDMNAADCSQSKSVLRKRLNELRAQLDRYLSDEYGIKIDDPAAYASWRTSHHPFHWLVEFYGIMRDGGFDVILGNPPYVEYSKVRATYQVIDFKTFTCGNLYVFVIERSMRLKNTSGRMGLIVPLSFVCTRRMSTARTLVAAEPAWISCFDIRPSSLFDDVAQRLAVVVTGGTAGGQFADFTAGYHRWMSDERKTLFQRLAYTGIAGIADHMPFIPKLSAELERALLKKLGQVNLGQLVNLRGGEFIAHRIVRYFVKAFTFVPSFVDANNGCGRSEDYKSFRFEPRERVVVCALINTSLFYWFWRASSDGFHCGYGDVYAMPYNGAIADPSRRRIHELHAVPMEDIIGHSRTRSVATRRGRISYQEFDMKRSKHIVDEMTVYSQKHGDLPQRRRTTL